MEPNRREEERAAVQRWIGGIGSECAWWIRYILEKPQELRRRSSGDFPFQFAALFPGVSDLKVLDVGSGFGSSVGTLLSEGGRISLRACDPLAPLYNALAAVHGFTVNVKNEFMHGECLLNHLGRDSFDFVYMRNALDHSFNPFLVVKNMLSVCKVGGIVYLYHIANEGRRADYNGLHQWDIHLDQSNHLRLDNKYTSESVDVSERLSPYARFESEIVDVNDGTGPLVLVKAVITKIAPYVCEERQEISDYDEMLHSALYYSMLMSEKLKMEIATTDQFGYFAKRYKELYERHHD